jgi:fatty-acyl-CoA synthase
VLDQDDGDVVPGSIGELVLRGESVLKGYWGMPAAIAEVVRDGWLRTADLVRVDRSGYLTVQ